MKEQINDSIEYNLRLLKQHKAEYERKLKTDPDFVREKRLSPRWPEIYALVKKEGIKLADEDD